MTTERELHDLLTADVDAPARPAPWEDVVRRGRHHRRVARARKGLFACGLAAVAIIGTSSLVGRIDDKDTAVVANDPERTTTTRDISKPDLSRLPDLTAARVSTTRVTLLLSAADPELGFDPCTEQVPQVEEGPDVVHISIAKTFELPGLTHWFACQSSPFSTWATIELSAPLGSRRLTDGKDGRAIQVIDEAELLFPSTLPQPFDVARWDEFSNGAGWTFSWSAGDMVLSVSTSPTDGQRPASCSGETVEVRGSSGNLCRAELSHELQWTEGSSLRALSVTDVGGNPLPAGIDLVQLANSLQPLAASPAGQ